MIGIPEIGTGKPTRQLHLDLFSRGTWRATAQVFAHDLDPVLPHLEGLHESARHRVHVLTLWARGRRVNAPAGAEGASSKLLPARRRELRAASSYQAQGDAVAQQLVGGRLDGDVGKLAGSRGEVGLGDPTVTAVLLGSIAAALPAAGFLLYQTRDPVRFRKPTSALARLVLSAATAVSIPYFGAFSPGPIVFVLAIYFTGLGKSIRMAFVVYAVS